MEVHTASWPPLEHGPLTRSGDVGVTEQQQEQSHPRQAESQSLDQQAADILKLFGETTEDDSPTMDFDAFHFDDTLASTHFAAMEHEATHIDHSHSDSSNSSSGCDSNIVPSHAFGPWPTMSDPHDFGYQQTALQPGSAQWGASAPSFDHRPMTFHSYQGGEHGLGIHMPPTSNPMSIPLIHRYDAGFAGNHTPSVNDFRGQQYSTWQHNEQSAPPQEDIFGDDVEEEEVDSADPCYAQLLHKCLKDAPHHTLSLRELYDWVSQHSQKAKDPNNRGWQNSVRHNLSMNAVSRSCLLAFSNLPLTVYQAFQRVTDRSSSSKKGSLWRLTDDALRDGVISTTRYRKDPKRKPERRAVPALNRQASGAKGGRATRDASRRRARPQYSPYSVSRSTPQSPFGHPYPPAIGGLPMAMSEPTSPFFSINPSSPYPGYHQATPEDFLAPPSKVTSFEMMPLSSGDGFFGDQDGEMDATVTPSLTEDYGTDGEAL